MYDGRPRPSRKRIGALPRSSYSRPIFVRCRATCEYAEKIGQEHFWARRPVAGSDFVCLEAWKGVSSHGFCVAAGGGLMCGTIRFPRFRCFFYFGAPHA